MHAAELDAKPVPQLLPTLRIVKTHGPPIFLIIPPEWNRKRKPHPKVIHESKVHPHDAGYSVHENTCLRQRRHARSAAPPLALQDERRSAISTAAFASRDAQETTDQ